MAEIKEREFELFFADKANVNMSSYHIDKKTQLPVLYLKNQKRGLCLICNDYAYQPFEDLIKLVSNNIVDKKIKNELITQLEMLRRHLKKDYENELLVYNNGTTKHVDCINHCLLYAFGECVEQHYSRCTACDQLFEVFTTLSHILGDLHNTLLSEYQEKLTCYLAHQTRKRYLSAQFNAALDELDDHDAVIIVDYKMRILPATARETKSEFFGKRGWTLHTTLVFQKKDNEKMDVQAYDHWSCDTKQDAWFTASCFEAVFNTINSRPHWIKIISDNGGHYHNSELMAIISHWYDWYGVEVRGWIFLESGEAKTTVDSHHATIAHAIKRYVRIGCELTSGQDIERAIEELSGTSVAQIEPNRNKNNNMILEKSCNANNKKTKTIPGISKWFVWDWPITGEAAGYVRVKSLPNIGEWTEFSPADIRTFCSEINRPNPEYTAPTKPKTPWLTSLSIKKDIQKSFEHDETQNSLNPTSGQMGVDADFPLKPGWSLKENQKMGNKGEELSVEDIPEIKTIKGWIGRYSASSKKEMSEKALEQNAIEENNFVARQEEIDTESTTHSRAKKRQKRS
ncbi:hypothetical protein RhiirA5_431840 [Rhizophagus irregularis]|uniref:C2H2-type domain-containing protein n=1 Tax=Rhizophagus irregularis TaxID=588596 RepID=A0A2N0NRY9_9GLOM|nr:hypothetical protein RhiirA5_433335 [Rhizophagus irregularis]PKB97750.1 hypothetical protein RhiirA5_432545 [Rhizophagus irregularis]PKB98150.1 hypothetical protein RhiirA5_431840 [Rhizophagus irregularis]